MEKKICNFCKESKDLNLFYKGQTECKKCRKDRDHLHYENNKDKRLNQIRTRKRESKKFIDSFKTECSECGEKHPATLEFHHLDSTEKEFEISQAVGYDYKRIEKEIAKCIILCSNCHRIVHWEERQAGIV